MADSEREWDGIPKCQDCKWPLDIKVSKFCPCRGNKDIDKYKEAFNEARKLQEQNIPLSDERYY